jgi:hypothetical protein
MCLWVYKVYASHREAVEEESRCVEMFHTAPSRMPSRDDAALVIVPTCSASSEPGWNPGSARRVSVDGEAVHGIALIAAQGPGSTGT